MTMSHEAAKIFIKETIEPMVKGSPSSTSSILEALEIALSSGNDDLVFAMANYISDDNELLNSKEVAHLIKNKVFGW